jgi:hypothetical protein
MMSATITLKIVNSLNNQQKGLEAERHLGKPKPTILDLNTGKYVYLEEKVGSTNYFFKKYMPIFTIINNVMYEIWLRIDPKDPTTKIPVLDIQMYKMRYGHRIKEIHLKEDEHHIHRKPDGIYQWKFESMEEKFILYINGAGLTFNAILSPPKSTGLTFDAILAPPKTSGLTVSISPQLDTNNKLSNLTQQNDNKQNRKSSDSKQ